MVTDDFDSLYAVIDDELFGIIKKISRSKAIEASSINNLSAMIIDVE